jgi:hypothetical protein
MRLLIPISPLAQPTLLSLPVTWWMGEASPQALKSR